MSNSLIPQGLHRVSAIVVSATDKKYGGRVNVGVTSLLQQRHANHPNDPTQTKDFASTFNRT